MFTLFMICLGLFLILVGFFIGSTLSNDDKKYMLVLKDNNKIKYFSEVKDIKAFIYTLEKEEQYSLFVRDDVDYVYLTSNVGDNKCLKK